MFDIKEFVESITNKEDLKKFLTAKAREDISIWIDEKVLPSIADGVKRFNEALREASETESGWCKIRDKFFIPAILNIAVWVFIESSKYIQKETKNNQ